MWLFGCRTNREHHDCTVCSLVFSTYTHTHTPGASDWQHEKLGGESVAAQPNNYGCIWAPLLQFNGWDRRMRLLHFKACEDSLLEYCRPACIRPSWNQPRLMPVSSANFGPLLRFPGSLTRLLTGAALLWSARIDRLRCFYCAPFLCSNPRPSEAVGDEILDSQGFQACQSCWTPTVTFSLWFQPIKQIQWSTSPFSPSCYPYHDLRSPLV